MKKFGRVAKVIMGTTGWFARGGDNNDRKICLSYNDIIICPVLIEAGLGNLDCPDESCTDDGTSVARPIPSVSEGLSHDRSFNHFSFRRACLLAESGLHVPGLSCVTYLHQQGPCKRPAWQDLPFRWQISVYEAGGFFHGLENRRKARCPNMNLTSLLVPAP
jgi:hypothetical protein